MSDPFADMMFRYTDKARLFNSTTGGLEDYPPFQHWWLPHMI